MIAYLKLYMANLKHAGTTGAAVILLTAWTLNKYTGTIPPPVADAIMALVGPAVLTFFANGNSVKP